MIKFFTITTFCLSPCVSCATEINPLPKLPEDIGSHISSYVKGQAKRDLYREIKCPSVDDVDKAIHTGQNFVIDNEDYSAIMDLNKPEENSILTQLFTKNNDLSSPAFNPESIVVAIEKPTFYAISYTMLNKNYPSMCCKYRIQGIEFPVTIYPKFQINRLDVIAEGRLDSSVKFGYSFSVIRSQNPEDVTFKAYLKTDEEGVDHVNAVNESLRGVKSFLMREPTKQGQ